MVRKNVTSLKTSPHRLHRLIVGLLFFIGVLFSSAASAADKIIVSGASGRLGSLVVEQLLEKGVKPADLILVSRSPDKLKSYADLGANTRFGDMDKIDSLPAAYAGGDRMLLISIGGSNRPVRHKRAIDAAIAAGVKQIAYTSFVNMENNDMPLANDHRATEELLKESGVAWTFLRNSIYMDGLSVQAAQILKQGSVEVPESEVGIGYATREDCAAAAVAVLTTSGHDNKAYDITGPSVVVVSDIAKAVSEITGKPIPIKIGNGGSVRTFSGNPSIAVVSNDVEQLTGKPATSLKEFLENNRGDWDQ